MLNEWSDRPPPKPPRCFCLRGEFWLAVAALAMGAALIAGVADFLLG